MNSPEAVILVGLGLVVYAVYRVVSGQRARNAAAARYQKMAQICAAHGAAPGPVEMPGMFSLLGAGLPNGLNNQFSNAADFWCVAESTRLFFTLVTARFPGVGMPHFAVTRRGLPGAPILGQNRIEVESIDFTNRFTVTAADRRLGMMLLDLPMIQWVLDCADVNFEMFADGLLAYVYRAEKGAPILNRAIELRPLNTDGSELELLYKFVAGFGPRIPAVLKAEFAASGRHLTFPDSDKDHPRPDNTGFTLGAPTVEVQRSGPTNAEVVVRVHRGPPTFLDLKLQITPVAQQHGATRAPTNFSL
jgi:hypothetical protein